MDYRDLGRTGLKVSAVGLGTGPLGSSNTEYAVGLVNRAVELGVTFFDTARSYWDAEVKLGLALQGQRSKVVISSKTGTRTRDEAWREINESLERLRTDYLDNCHLHGLGENASWEDLDVRLGPGGALEALIKAKEQGLIRHIGCTAHRSAVLIEALNRFDFEVVLIPMNFVEPEPLARLIPLCMEKGVGVTIMKPLGTGLLPAIPALKWLLSQPIASAVPGATTLEELEESMQAANGDPALTPAEQITIDEAREKLEHLRCRLCDACLPCPQNVRIPMHLGTDVMYDHYRTMGPVGFRAFPWSRARIELDQSQRARHISTIESCTRCGDCEARCPHGLPTVEMLQGMLPTMRDMMAFYEDVLANGNLAY